CSWRNAISRSNRANLAVGLQDLSDRTDTPCPFTRRPSTLCEIQTGKDRVKLNVKTSVKTSVKTNPGYDISTLLPLRHSRMASTCLCSSFIEMSCF
ncbi:hypothetical protein, partial [Paraburkholderia fungorum]|uniref:hypothetical protein n=1 Tax=Paraburkholderia fungorum TaxID=134537 RepID=UPI001C862715